MRVDLTEQFRGYISEREIRGESTWTASKFLKSSTDNLSDLISLNGKLAELDRNLRSGSRFNKQLQKNMITNIKQSMDACKQSIKRLATNPIDLRSSTELAQKLKDSILVSLQMRLLQSTFQFKELYVMYNGQGRREKSRSPDPFDPFQNPNQPQRRIDLNKSHFIDASDTQILQSVAVHEYGQLEKSIHRVAQMYEDSMNVVRMQDLLIGDIQGHVDDTGENVQEGRKNLADLQRKESKNRGFIIKVFVVLYVLVFVYLVLLN